MYDIKDINEILANKKYTQESLQLKYYPNESCLNDIYYLYAENMVYTRDINMIQKNIEYILWICDMLLIKIPAVKYNAIKLFLNLQSALSNHDIYPENHIVDSLSYTYNNSCNNSTITLTDLAKICIILLSNKLVGNEVILFEDIHIINCKSCKKLYAYQIKDYDLLIEQCVKKWPSYKELYECEQEIFILLGNNVSRIFLGLDTFIDVWSLYIYNLLHEYNLNKLNIYQIQENSHVISELILIEFISITDEVLRETPSIIISIILVFYSTMVIYPFNTINAIDQKNIIISMEKKFIRYYISSMH